jgi:hypothetical protein
MGMAGRMGPNQTGGMGMGQSRLPPSLQAKMDAVSLEQFVVCGTGFKIGILKCFSYNLDVKESSGRYK